MSMSTYKPTVYFDFTATLRLYSNAEIPYFEASTISISEDSGSQIFGITSASTTEGYYTFNIYFNTAGSKTITAAVYSHDAWHNQSQRRSRGETRRSDHDSGSIVGKSMVFVKSQRIKITLSEIVRNN